MKRWTLVILTLALFTIAPNAQTLEFNHKAGKYLEVDGASIYYEEIENEGKPTMLFLHGGFGSIEDFNPIVDMFADDYHIVGIDSRTHGKSTSGTGKLTYKRLQLDVEAVVNHLQLTDIHIIGFSDGGIIAYRLAAANRIPIRKIVTIGATWSLTDAELMEEIVADMTPEVWGQIFDFYQLHNPEPNVDRPVEHVVQMWVDKTEDGYPLESVENITIPTLIIRGNDDNSIPLESAIKLASKIEKSVLFNIPFGPHDAHNKYPQMFETITKEFLNKDESSFFMNNAVTQSTETNLDQVELMKQFLGIWEGEFGNNTFFKSENKQFSRGIVSNSQVIIDDKIVDSIVQIYGYDKKIDKFIIAELKESSPAIELCLVWFTSERAGEIVISNPEGAPLKFEFEFKSSDILEQVAIQDNKIVKKSFLKELLSIELLQLILQRNFKDYMKIGFFQYNVIWRDRDANLAYVRDKIKGSTFDLLVLPEFSPVGMPLILRMN